MTPARRCCARAPRRTGAAGRAARVGLGIAAAVCGGVAHADPGLSVSVASDDRFRGQSTSDRLPVATGAISYDDVRGPYVGASVTLGPTRHDGPRLLRSVQYAGYAHRLRSGISLDAGVINRLYTRYATVEYARSFAELYVGVVGRRMSTRLSFSPNYDGHAHSATYAEVDALLFDSGAWSLTGHIGLLAPPSYAEHYYRRPQRVELDGRFGVTRRFGRLGVSATLVGGGPDEEDRGFQGTIVVAATRSF